MENCNHDWENSICINCGLCSELYILDDNYKNLSSNIHTVFSCTPLQETKMIPLKSPRTPPASTYRKIKLITNKLECTNYTDTIIAILSNFKFPMKISVIDKIIICLYQNLLENGFPLSINDLTKYTKTKKAKLLKLHRDCFYYKSKSTEYYRSLYDRCRHTLEIYGIENKDLFSIYMKTVSQCPNSNPIIHCYSFLIKHYFPTVSIRELHKLPQEYTESIRKQIKKLDLI